MHLEAARNAVEQTRGSIRQSKMDADRKQLQLREREARLVDLEVKLNQAKANREYQSLKEQLAADVQANLVLSDEILETLESVDEQEQSLVGLVENEKNSEEEQKKLQDSVTQRMQALQADLERVQAELKALEETLEGDFRTEYFRRVPHRGEDAMAEVDGQSCGGCYTVLSPHALDKLRMGRYVACSSCGRLVYTPEGKTV